MATITRSHSHSSPPAQRSAPPDLVCSRRGVWTSDTSGVLRELREQRNFKGEGGRRDVSHLWFCFNCIALRQDKTKQNKTKQRTAVLCFVLTLNTYTLSCCQPAAPSRCRNVARVRFSLQTGENEKEKRKSSSISKVTRFETFTLNRLAKFWIWFLRHDFPTAGYGLRHGHSRLSESARGFPYLDFLFLLSSLSHLISSPLAPPRLGWTNFVEQNHPKNQQDKTEDGGLSPITRKDPSRPTRDNLLSYRNQPCNPATALYCFLFFSLSSLSLRVDLLYHIVHSSII